MTRTRARADKIEPIIYEFLVKYQHDRTGWMAWPEGLPVTAIGPTKTGVCRKLRGAVQAYLRSTLRCYGDPLPPPPRRVSAEADTIMVCAWLS